MCNFRSYFGEDTTTYGYEYDRSIFEDIGPNDTDEGGDVEIRFSLEDEK